MEPPIDASVVSAASTYEARVHDAWLAGGEFGFER